MSWEAWLTLAVVLVMVIALARDAVAPALAVLVADIALMVTGVIDARAAFSGFSNPAPITVAALYVLARAVEKTGAMQPLVARALGNGGNGGHRNGQRSALARLMLPTAGASAFLNNTPIVALLAPQVTDWAEKRGRSPSTYLMPLSFAAILGGTITLIGTSTNLVVAGLMQDAGMAPLAMFELTPVGLPVALLGCGLLVLLAPVLLPARRGAREQFQREMREFVMQCDVVPRGPLDGSSVEAGGLRHLQGVFLVQIDRGTDVIAPATPETVLRGGDRLTFAGRVDMVRDLQTHRGLVSAERAHTHDFNTADHTFYEAVISPASPLVGSTLRDAKFRSRYQSAVLAIHRSGGRVNEKLGTVELKEGDTLLLAADRSFAQRWRDTPDFLLISHLGGSPPPSTRQALLVGAVGLAVVLLAGAGLLPILHAALIGVLVLIAARVLTPGEARAAVDFDVIILIAASFGIGAAITQSGLAGIVASGLVTPVAALGPVAVLGALALATIALTELITNNAAAVLLFPIATAAANTMGVDPRPFMIALTIAASASFLTPIGYQTNTMVYGMGGYRFGDFARLGLPLTVLVLVLILLIVPAVWPFNG